MADNHQSIMFSAETGKPVSNETKFPMQEVISTDAAPAAARSVRVTGGGKTRVTFGPNGGRVEQLEAERFRAQDMKPVDAGISGTARTASGAPKAAADLRGDDLLSITLSDGTQTQTSVAAALRMGMIRKTSNGYEDVAREALAAPQTQPNAASAAAQKPAEAQPEPVRPEPIDPMAVNLPMLGGDVVAEITKGLPSHVIARAVIEASNGQRFSPEVIMAASRNNPDQPEAALQRSMMALQVHYDTYLSRTGVDRNAFTEWATKHRGDTLGSAMTRHAVTQDARVYGPLVREFKQSRGIR